MGKKLKKETKKWLILNKKAKEIKGEMDVLKGSIIANMKTEKIKTFGSVCLVTKQIREINIKKVFKCLTVAQFLEIAKVKISDLKNLIGDTQLEKVTLGYTESVYLTEIKEGVCHGDKKSSD